MNSPESKHSFMLSIALFCYDKGTPDFNAVWLIFRTLFWNCRKPNCHILFYI